MIYENENIDQTNAFAGSHAPTSISVLTWLLWLRLWVMNACGFSPAYVCRAMPSAPQALVRARRQSRAHFARCGLPPARNLSALRALLPRNLSPTQTLERLTKISVLGRTVLYRILSWGSVLLRRALLVCYDHGWWRAPMCVLRTRREPMALRPP